MKNLEEIKTIIQSRKAEIKDKYNVAEIGVFGSFVNSRSRKKHDLDILVTFSKPIGLFKFIEFEEYLTELVGIKVDLVTKLGLKPRIGEYILKEVQYL